MKKDKIIDNLEFIIQDKKIMENIKQNDGLIIGKTKKEVVKMLLLGNTPFVSDTLNLEIYYDDETKEIGIQVSNGKKTRNFFNSYARNFDTVKLAANDIVHLI